MAAYKDLVGQKITKVTSNPGEPKTGQMWYNSTDGKLRGLGVVTAWASAANLNTARERSGNFGAQTAGICCGGLTSVPSGTPSAITTTEEYNGTGWSSGGAMNTARSELFACGTQTAGLAAGGAAPVTSNSEEYNGTAWSEGNNLGTARSDFAFQFGIQTAAVAAGGYISTASALNEEYDGTSWSEVNNIPTGTFQGGGLGTQTAGLGFGGYTTATVADSFSYDGTNWTASSDLNLARRVRITNFGASADSGYVYGGITPAGNRQTTGSEWNGSSWTAAPASTSIGKQNSNGGGAASSTAGWAAAGNVAPNNVASTTEEFTQSTNTITAAAWATIANFPDSRAYSGGSGGTPTSTLVFGGYTGPGLGGFVSSGAEFDGSSWTATGDYPIDVVGVAGLGPVTAGLGTGGYKDTATNVTSSYEYDGSSWTAGNSANAAGQGAKMAGTQTAASMGNRSGDGDGHEQYDGTNWTTATNTPVSGNAGAMMAGTQTALLMYGGENAPKVRTEEWNGSSWTSGNNMNLDRRQGSHGGTQTYAIAGGGDSNPGIFGNTELWDGTSWASSVSMGTARFYQVGGTSVGPGGVTSNIAATGRTPGSTHSNNCEEFSSETITANITDFTTS